MLGKIAVVVVMLVAAVQAGCPSNAELGEGVCARVFKERGCMGDSMDVEDGAVVNELEPECNNVISAVVVAPKCHLRVYDGTDLKGSYGLFSQAVFPDLSKERRLSFTDPTAHWDNQITSIKCSCF